MKPEPDTFQDLRRLLALKRYEQPPPGFHDRFARQVMARIRAGEAASLHQVSWLQRFWSALETKPVLASAFGATVCLALGGGIFYTSQIEDSLGAATASAILPAVTTPVEPPAVQFADMPDDRPLFLRATSQGANHGRGSVLPSQQAHSLFQRYDAKIEPATFQNRITR